MYSSLTELLSRSLKHQLLVQRPVGVQSYNVCTCLVIVISARPFLLPLIRTVTYLIDDSSSFNCEFSPLNSCTGEEYSLHYVTMTSLIILALLKIELHVGTSDTP